MTPLELGSYLNHLVASHLKLAVMIWGAPGVGKSSIVAQTAAANGLEFVDVRLSQLAPTDLRGLPVPEDGVAKWFPPEFLPRSGRGVLFMDELNMAAPTMQGIAQQLILDRKVGSYTLPDGWFIWAAGNRREDRASVFEMPAPLANRFLHLEIAPDLDSFKRYAFARNLSERIVAFLSFRPNLLHALDAKSPAWASPRSWDMASQLLSANLEIAPAVGEGAAAEFTAFEKVYAALPDLEPILHGDLERDFPEEASAKYAATVGLTMRVETARQAVNAFLWLSGKAAPEWVQFFAADAFPRLREKGQIGAFAEAVRHEPSLQAFLREYRDLIGL
jgi:AAA domain (dynein-related subfamily)